MYFNELSRIADDSHSVWMGCFLLEFIRKHPKHSTTITDSLNVYLYNLPKLWQGKYCHTIGIVWYSCHCWALSQEFCLVFSWNVSCFISLVTDKRHLFLFLRITVIHWSPFTCREFCWHSHDWPVVAWKCRRVWHLDGQVPQSFGELRQGVVDHSQKHPLTDSLLHVLKQMGKQTNKNKQRRKHLVTVRNVYVLFSCGFPCIIKLWTTSW